MHLNPMFRTLPLLALCAASAASASITTFTDQAAFLAAAAAIPGTETLKETFGGPLTKVHLQDYSDFPHFGPDGKLLPADSIFGYKAKVTSIGGGRLTGCVGHICNGNVVNVTTVWTFTRPLVAFGATFNYSYLDDPNNPPRLNGIRGLGFRNGFFGFISSDPIGSFAFQAEDAVTPNPTQPDLPPTVTYTMQELLLQQDRIGHAAIPEPSGFGIASTGMAVLAGFLLLFAPFRFLK